MSQTAVGRGVMAVWNDVEPGRETEFDAWYRRQHVPERLQQPGFREARRYVADGSTPRHCALYWLDSVAALATPAYLARLAQPTRWTRRAMPWFRNMARTPCRVALDYGHGIGGMMIWIALLDASIAQATTARLAPVLAALCDDADIVRAQLWICDAEMRARTNPEQRLRGARDRVAEWIVCIEGARAPALTAAADRVRSATRDEAGDPVVGPCYRLLWQIHASESPPPCPDDDAGVSFEA